MSLFQLIAYVLLSLLLLVPAAWLGWEGLAGGMILYLVLGAPLRDMLGVPLLRWYMPPWPNFEGKQTFGRFADSRGYIQPLMWRYPDGFEPTVHEATTWHLKRNLRAWLHNPLDIGRIWVVWQGSDGRIHAYESVWPHLFVRRWKESPLTVRDELYAAERQLFVGCKESVDR